ncbi:MAG: alginate export family protein [bacterium]
MADEGVNVKKVEGTTPPPAALVKEEALFQLDGGFDSRSRYDWYDNPPNSDGAINKPFYSYYRLRSRAWGSATTGNYGLYIRLGNEFRVYDNYAPSHNYNRFPDQLFVDNLYVDFKNLLYDRVDIRSGRQDLKYGAGRIIYEGTPSDGSRSEYFDAIKMTVRVTEKTSGDFFTSYTKPVDNFLTVGNADGQNYNLTSYDGTVGPGKDDDLTEWGVGTYWTIKEFKECPLDLYAVYKDESAWHKKGNSSDTLRGRQYATFGTRLVPRFTENFSGEFEGAYQFGRTGHNDAMGIDGQPINAYMLYGGLTYKAQEFSMKPYLTIGTLYLSGDDKQSKYDSTSSDEAVTGWNPVFARATIIGELPVKMYGSSYRYSNLSWTYIEPGFEPFKDHKFKLQTGPLFAPVNDNQEDRNSNLYRGWHTLLKYECILLKEMVNTRGAIKTAVQLEHMAYGDYYEQANAPENAYFARIELSVSF